MFSARKLTSIIRTPTTNYVRALSTAQQNVPKMFCYQCEQTHLGTGCTTKGVCGKDAKTSNLQDLLIHTASGVGQLAATCAKNQISVPPTVNQFLLDSIFSTVTNVNFDSVRIQSYIKEAIELQGQLTKLLDNSGKPILESSPRPVQFKYVDDVNALDVLGSFHGVKARKAIIKNDDLHGLQEIALYGIKGAVAYFSHAERIRSVNASAYTQEESNLVYKSLYDLLDRFINPSHDLGDLVGLAMDVGKFNLEVMRLLDQAHSASFGISVPREATSTPKPGKAILVSGHDMIDLLYVLEQTKGTGINVYTHGEMLPAHGYPKLAAHSHLAGHFGGAWMKQRKDFHNFPGAILMTSNCIVEPDRSYVNRIFTTNSTGVAGVKHIDNLNFDEVIACANTQPGFIESVEHPLTSSSAAKVYKTGYAHSFASTDAASSELAQAVIQGKLKNVFVVGGCDGREGERSYFSNFGEDAPKDSIILTLGCGKFRLNHLPIAQENLSDTRIPRLIDVGQCNDAFGALRIATGLATALGTTVHQLPLHFALSWFEQKAVAVLLSLLHLGVQGIRLGPNLPGFITPNLLQAFSDKFKMAPISHTAAEDIKKMVG